MRDIKWVLIIEKEVRILYSTTDQKLTVQAVYRRLAKNRYHMRAAAGKGILVTVRIPSSLH